MRIYGVVIFLLSLCVVLNAQTSQKQETKKENSNSAGKTKEISSQSYVTQKQKESKNAEELAKRYTDRAKKAEKEGKEKFAEASKECASAKEKMCEAYSKMSKGRKTFLKAKDGNIKDAPVREKGQWRSTYIKEIQDYIDKYSTKASEAEEKGNKELAERYHQIVDGKKMEVEGLKLLQKAENQFGKARDKYRKNK